MPTEDEDGDIVSWALRPGTNGGMFRVGNDGTFSQDPVLAQEGPGNSFTPSPNTRRQSPRAEEEETGDEEEPRKRRRTDLVSGVSSHGVSGIRQRAKANRQACQVFMAGGKTHDEWLNARASWPFPRWRL
jgi:hypothetical protein